MCPIETFLVKPYLGTMKNVFVLSTRNILYTRGFGTLVHLAKSSQLAYVRRQSFAFGVKACTGDTRSAS